MGSPGVDRAPPTGGSSSANSQRQVCRNDGGGQRVSARSKRSDCGTVIEGSVGDPRSSCVAGARREEVLRGVKAASARASAAQAG